MAHANGWIGEQWSVMAKYMDIGQVTSTNQFNAMHLAGIKTVYHQDPHEICVTPGVCEDRPPSSQLNSSSYMKCNYNGLPVEANSISQGTNVYFGDPTSTKLIQATTNYTSNALTQGAIDYLSLDGTMMLEDEQSPSMNCAGPQWWMYANSAAYSDANWIADMESFDTAMLRPVLAGDVCMGDGSTAGSGSYWNPSPILGVVTNPNTAGVFCGSFAEGTFANTSGKAVAPQWQSRENAALQAQGAGKLFIANPRYSQYVGDPLDQRGFYYASFMLIYDPNYSVYESEGFGVTPASGIDIEPEQMLQPMNPLKTSHYGIDNIEGYKSGGVYVREFANCYYWGTSIGACAAIVNPDQQNSYSLPTLTQTYHHSVSLSGYGIFSGQYNTPNLNDNGILSSTNAVPSTIPAGGWEILVQ